MSIFSVVISAIASFLIGVLARNLYLGNPFNDPFILEMFISNTTHINGPIGFKVVNTTQRSLNTYVTVKPIINGAPFSIIPYSMVLNPGQKYTVEEITGDYRNIRNISTMHALNARNYENNAQPLKFELTASFNNSRIAVFRFKKQTTIVCAYQPKDKTFIRIK